MNIRHEFSSFTPMRHFLLLAGLAWVLPSRTQPAIAPGLLKYAAGALAGLIEGARQKAIADGVRPIPTTVYRSLLGYFPAALLQKCRFAASGSRTLNLPALSFSYGDPTAIALGDVVLFRNDKVAEGDLKVWAHELTHVMQYQRWGIEGFADRYVCDTNVVEQEAIDNANRFAAWLPRRGLPSASHS